MITTLVPALNIPARLAVSSSAAPVAPVNEMEAGPNQLQPANVIMILFADFALFMWFRMKVPVYY